MTTLIGISGFKGSGKDTLARALSQEHSFTTGWVSTITHYADRLKNASAQLFGLDPMLFYDEVLKEEQSPMGRTPRKILTDMHDALVPMFGEDMFVSSVRDDWMRHKKAGCGGLFIIADVRYDGRETDWIRNEGGSIIHITRPGVTASEHSSEKGIQFVEGDKVVCNNGSKIDLREAAIRLLLEIL